MDGEIQEGGIWGMKVEFWDDDYHRWVPESSLFFYDHRIQMKVCLDTNLYLNAYDRS